MSDRAELIRNALAFLTDPNTRGHPLTQRIAFLESKGLSQEEIESVLAQSQAANAFAAPSVAGPSSVVSGGTAYAPVPQQQYVALQQPPPIPQRDWRDYFIMAVVSGGFVFGVVSFARKYLLPHLKPPSITAYEADHNALTAQFDSISSLISSIESQTASQKTSMDEQKEKVDRAIDALQVALNEAREEEVKTKRELREIRDEVGSVRDGLPKMLEKNKDAQSQALLDLQQELKSLKTLLLTRSSGGPPLSSSSGLPSSPSLPPSFPHSTSYGAGGIGALAGSAPALPRPSIPSWQLASAPSTPAAAPVSAAPVPVPVSTPLVPTASASSDAKGKGKATEDLASSGVLVSEASESEGEDAASSIVS